jgi:hypothetical protein
MVDVLLADAPAGVDAAAWAAANAAVRAYCGWHVAPVVTETVTLDGSGTNLMFLPTLHLVDLVSIVNDGETVEDPEWSAVGVVRGTWTTKFRGVVATMEHGHTVCPPEILAVLTEIATSDLPGSATSLASGPYKVGFGSTGPNAAASHASVLDAYRIARVS